MSECTSKYYIEDLEAKSCELFQDVLVSEGTSMYEVIRIIDGIPLFLEKHIGRLKKTADIIKKDIWLDEIVIEQQIYDVIKINNILNGNVKIIFNFNKKNTFLAYFIAHNYPTELQYNNGVNTVLFNGERSNPNAKIVSKNFRIEVEKYIKEKEAFEAILVDRSGFILEGSKSNIFMVKNNKVLTAPIEGVLPGITREIIIDICKKGNIDFEEEKVHENKISCLDALFITGTSPKVLPISKVESFAFDSSNNSIVLNIMEAYNKIIKEYINNSK